MKKRGLLYNTLLTSTGFWLFLALVILWIPWLGETPFYSKGEPREAIVAVSILQSGDWILPVNFGDDIPYKPPFLAWLIAIFAWIFNGGVVNEFISRLPSALAAIAMIMMGYNWAKKAQGDRFALIMALVTATSFEVFRAAMACRVDMVLTAAMVGAVYIIHEIRQRPGRDNVGWYAAAAGMLTVATLTKGPVGSLLPCLAGGIYLLMRGDNFFKVSGRMILLCLVSFMLPALWYYAAWKRGGDVFLDLAWEENIGRLTGTMSYSSHEKPFWYNFITIIAGMLPWTLLVLLSLFRAGTFRHWPLNPAGMLAMVTACTVILFYCIPASKRSVYLLPAYPFMAYGVTVIIESLRGTGVVRFFGRTMAFIGVAVPVCMFVLAFIHNPFVDDFGLLHWWQWFFALIPLVVSIWWYMGRSKSPVAMPTVFTLFLCYSSAVMPSVLHNPLKTDEAVAKFERVCESQGVVWSVKHPQTGRSTYWMNYYLGDRMRSLSSVEQADTMASGRILIFSDPADTAGMSAAWQIEILGYNPDVRRPAYMATKIK